MQSVMQWASVTVQITMEKKLLMLKDSDASTLVSKYIAYITYCDKLPGGGVLP